MPALEERVDPLPVPEAEANFVLAEELEPLLAHETDENHVVVDENDHLFDQADEENPAPEDPLAVSPVLLHLGFARVQSAYDQWLQNMSHTVSLSLSLLGFRATVYYYDWPPEDL